MGSALARDLPLQSYEDKYASLQRMVNRYTNREEPDKVADFEKKQCDLALRWVRAVEGFDPEDYDLETAEGVVWLLRRARGCDKSLPVTVLHPWTDRVEAFDRAASGEAIATALAEYDAGNGAWVNRCGSRPANQGAGCAPAFKPRIEAALALRDQALAAGSRRAAHFHETVAWWLKRIQPLLPHRAKLVPFSVEPEYTVRFVSDKIRTDGNCGALRLALERVSIDTVWNHPGQETVIKVDIDAVCSGSSEAGIRKGFTSGTVYETVTVGTEQRCWSDQLVDMGQIEGCTPATYQVAVYKEVLGNHYWTDAGTIWDACDKTVKVEAGCEEVEVKQTRAVTEERTITRQGASSVFKGSGALVLHGEGKELVVPFHFSASGSGSGREANLQGEEELAINRMADALEGQIYDALDTPVARMTYDHALPRGLSYYAPRTRWTALTAAQREAGRHAALTATTTDFRAEEYLLEGITAKGHGQVPGGTPPPELTEAEEGYWERVYGKAVKYEYDRLK